MMTTRNEAGSGFQAPPNGLIKSDFQTKLAMNKGKQFPGEKILSPHSMCLRFPPSQILLSTPATAEMGSSNDERGTIKSSKHHHHDKDRVQDRSSHLHRDWDRSSSWHHHDDRDDDHYHWEKDQDCEERKREKEWAWRHEERDCEERSRRREAINEDDEDHDRKRRRWSSHHHHRDAEPKEVAPMEEIDNEEVEKRCVTTRTDRKEQSRNNWRTKEEDMKLEDNWLGKPPEIGIKSEIVLTAGGKVNARVLLGEDLSGGVPLYSPRLQAQGS
jgi:hypothetical protein